MRIEFLKSPQGYEDHRVNALAQEAKRDGTLEVSILNLTDRADLLGKLKLRYGPAIVIDDRIEFIGIPSLSDFWKRVKFLQERPPAVPGAPVNPPQTSVEKPL